MVSLFRCGTAEWGKLERCILESGKLEQIIFLKERYGETHFRAVTVIQAESFPSQE